MESSLTQVVAALSFSVIVLLAPSGQADPRPIDTEGLATRINEESPYRVPGLWVVAFKTERELARLPASQAARYLSGLPLRPTDLESTTTLADLLADYVKGTVVGVEFKSSSGFFYLDVPEESRKAVLDTLSHDFRIAFIEPVLTRTELMAIQSIEPWYGRFSRAPILQAHSAGRVPGQWIVVLKSEKEILAPPSQLSSYYITDPSLIPDSQAATEALAKSLAAHVGVKLLEVAAKQDGTGSRSFYLEIEEGSRTSVLAELARDTRVKYIQAVMRYQ